MDLEGFRDGFQTLLHIKSPHSKRQSLVLSQAGLIGLNGMPTWEQSLEAYIRDNREK